MLGVGVAIAIAGSGCGGNVVVDGRTSLVEEGGGAVTSFCEGICDGFSDLSCFQDSPSQCEDGCVQYFELVPSCSNEIVDLFRCVRENLDFDTCAAMECEPLATAVTECAMETPPAP